MSVVIGTLPNLTLVPYNSSKALIFYIQKSKILKLLENLIKNSRVTKRTVDVDHQLRKFDLLNKFYIITYVLIMTLPTLTTLNEYFFYGHRRAIIEIWFPFDDTGNNFGFFSGILFIIWAGGNVCFIIVSADFFIFATIFVLSILFDALKEDLKTAIDEGNVKEIRALIERHQNLIQLSDELERVFSFIFIYSFLDAAFALGFSGFQLAAAKSILDYSLCVPYTIGTLAQIYFYCYFGQRLIESSFNVADGIAQSEWSDLEDVKVKRLLILIIQRSQKPKQLSILGFASLMMETFTKISTSAYSYYTLLKEIYFE